ncbi:MAG TPA: hypothetical protein PKB06_10555, partial [Actinotalea sp.]|nr:hypothetical protein [Actinotalea sp.]
MRRALRVEGRSVEGRSVEGRVVEVTVDLADGQAALHGPPGALDALRRWVGGDRSGELPSDPLLDPLVS